MCERALWLSVLSLAIEDCLFFVASEEKRRLCRRSMSSRLVPVSDFVRAFSARRYLSLSNPSFRSVCDNAGLDPAYVHRVAWERISAIDSLTIVKVFAPVLKAKGDLCVREDKLLSSFAFAQKNVILWNSSGYCRALAVRHKTNLSLPYKNEAAKCSA
jgi:hypothetical protein